MNFFFGINNKIFKSELQIPLFQNRGNKPKNLKLFKVYPNNSKWILQDLENKLINDFFYLLKKNDISNNEIYFLANERDLESFDQNKLEDFNNFTDTSPAYRSNFKIFIENGGFSSYQSEYPYNMIKKKGSILSPVNSLVCSNSDKNYLLIKNIFQYPIQEKFNAYFVDYKEKKVIKKIDLITNYTNCIEISSELIKPDILFFTANFLGVPMYVSIKNKNISFEHTHPPHEYILSENRYLRVSSLKKEVDEIIN